MLHILQYSNLYYIINLKKLPMKMYRLLLHLPLPLKRKLDTLRREGYTASGYIRALLERELKETQVARKRDAAWKAK